MIYDLLSKSFQAINSSVCEDRSIDELEENNLVELRNSGKKLGCKAAWDNDILEDQVSVSTENADYTDKMIFRRNTRNFYNSVNCENIIKEVRKMQEERGQEERDKKKDARRKRPRKFEINLRK